MTEDKDNIPEPEAMIDALVSAGAECIRLHTIRTNGGHVDHDELEIADAERNRLCGLYQAALQLGYYDEYIRMAEKLKKLGVIE